MMDTMQPQVLESLTQFGAAGLMGVLWIWERLLSRRREKQLSDAHARIMHNREQLRIVIKLVRRNTQAIERFAITQTELNRLLGHLHEHVSRRSQ